jgi:hypothetical protein
MITLLVLVWLLTGLLGTWCGRACLYSRYRQPTTIGESIPEYMTALLGPLNLVCILIVFGPDVFRHGLKL